ncbi:tetratricopeptide repeat protein [candidate division KSB1 bacterium]|nr:tetratricopeptide repeat protein [candidate division KSB1 bacterium]
MQKKNSWFLQSLALVVVLTIIAALFISFGCAPPPAKPTTLSPEQEKARQDSLQKAYNFELLKVWSTGYEHYKNKDYRSALKPFWKIAEIDTIQKFKDVYSKLVEIYFKMENADSVQIACEEGLKEYPDNLYLRRSLAHILTAREMTDEAIEQYEQIVQIDNNSAADYKKLGNLYLKQGNAEAAIESYEAASRIDPKDAESQDVLSKLYEQVDPEEMVAKLEELIKLDPKNTEAIFKLGKTRFNRDEYAKAEELFRNYLQQLPEDVYAMEYLGNSLQNQSKYQEAINVYDEILKKEPNRKKLYCEQASCYKSLNQYSKARSLTDKALAIDQGYGLAYIVRGEIYEACVEYCMEQEKRTEANFDDKLINLMAWEEYRKATDDLAYKDMAEKKMRWIWQFTPTKEDKFFNKGKTRAACACYRWIY